MYKLFLASVTLKIQHISSDLGQDSVKISC